MVALSRVNFASDFRVRQSARTDDASVIKATDAFALRKTVIPFDAFSGMKSKV